MLLKIERFGAKNSPQIAFLIESTKIQRFLRSLRRTGTGTGDAKSHRSLESRYGPAPTGPRLVRSKQVRAGRARAAAAERSQETL